jgi:hypothetical protein
VSNEFDLSATERAQIASDAAAHPGTVAAFAPLEKYLSKFYAEVHWLGQVPAATGVGLTRDVLLCRNYGFYRENLLGYIGGHGGRRHSLAYRDGHWVLDGRADLSEGPAALCLHNLLYFRLAYPAGDALFPAIRGAYEAAAEKYGELTDIHPRNVLLTPRGVEVIDYLEMWNRDQVYGEGGFRRSFPKYFFLALGKIGEALAAGSLEPYRRGFEEFT